VIDLRGREFSAGMIASADGRRTGAVVGESDVGAEAYAVESGEDGVAVLVVNEMDAPGVED